ncbi:MAG: hypothetical protein HY329_08655 [Chloroflexi bacterium]|nr:hypothetical protein [Chloroflexota bacterium]
MIGWQSVPRCAVRWGWIGLVALLSWPTVGETAAVVAATPVKSVYLPVIRQSVEWPPPRVVTEADFNSVLRLRVGQQLRLSLDSGWEWTVTIEDERVVRPAPTQPREPSGQGLYEARSPGRTALTATGSLPCHRAQPPCLAPNRLFYLQIEVS